MMPLILKCVVPKLAGGLRTIADESVSSSVEPFETLAARGGRSSDWRPACAGDDDVEYAASPEPCA